MTGHARIWKCLMLGALVGCAPEGQWQPGTAELENLGQSTAALTYVEEANFDLDTEDWIPGNSYTSIARDTSRFHNGSAALLVKSTSTTEAKARSPRFTVVPGRKYTARGWVIADTTARSTGLQIDWYASGGGYISSSMHYASNSTASWGERAVIGAVAPSVAAGATADADYARIAIVFKTTVSGEQHRVDSLTVTDDTNTLTPSNQTFDSNAADWAAKANTTLSRDTAKVYEGSGALLLKASAAGDVKAESARFDVVAGKAYDLRGWVLADATARSAGLQLDWFDSAGNYISSSMHYATSSTTAWGERATLGVIAPSVAGGAMADATQASVAIVVKSCAAGEQHRADSVTVTTAAGGGGGTFVYDEQFSGTYTFGYGDNGTHENLWMEWRGNEAVAVGSGVMKLTGNTKSSDDGGFHRIFSTRRYGGPGKKLIIKYRARMTALYDDGGWGGYQGVKIGLKFPTSCTGYSEDDPRSVEGGTSDPNCSPASFQFVTGLGMDGRVELARSKFGTGYYPFEPAAVKLGYVTGTWKNVTVLAEHVATDRWRIKYWHNHDMSGAPILDWEGEAPYNEPGFLWYRTDFSDFEYDFLTIEELSN